MVLGIVQRNVAVCRAVFGLSVVAGAIGTPMILFTDSVIGRLTPAAASGGGGAIAVGVVPLLFYLRWGSRQKFCSDYHRVLKLYLRDPIKVELGGFRIITNMFWSLYKEVLK